MADDPKDVLEDLSSVFDELSKEKQRLAEELQSQLSAITAQIDATIESARGYRQLERLYQSEVGDIQRQLKRLNEMGSLSEEEERQRELLEGRRRSAIAGMAEAAMEREKETQTIGGLRAQERSKTGEIAGVVKEHEDKKEMDGLNKEISLLSTEYAHLRKNSREVSRETSQLKSAVSNLKSPFANMVVGIIGTNKTYETKRKENEKLIEQLKKRARREKLLGNTEKAAKLETEAANLATKMKTDAIMRNMSVMNQVTSYMTELGKTISSLVKVIRDTQREFAIGAGEAAKLKFQNFVTSVDSFASAITTFGKTIPVTAAEIQRAQLDFQEQFGMLIDPKEAEVLAAEAKKMGVTTQQLAEARRVFLTQSSGDVSRAMELESEFTKSFEDVLGAGGAKAAFEFIGKNSELVARSGARFQQSLMRAAAEAKRIGVDLNKVNQVGDNIIGNFEGFLESTAELGAMGFNLDSTRLAQIAESGDTGALFTELQSQLAMTGKDLSSLRRSEQLALSSAFGMSMEEFQRMAGGDIEKPVEQQLQEDANGILTNILKKLGIFDSVSGFLQKFGPQLTAFGEALGPAIVLAFKGMGFALHTFFLKGIYFNTMGVKNLKSLSRLFGRGGRGFMRGGGGGGVRGAMSAKPGVIRGLTGIPKMPGLGAAGSRLATGARVGARFAPLAGIVGGVMGFKQGRDLGMDKQASAGAGVVRGGAAMGGTVAGAALGSMLLPGIGTAVGGIIGGFVGDKLGAVLNEKAPGLAANMGAMFSGFLEPLKDVFDIFKGAFAPLIDSFKTLFSIFSTSGEAGEVSKFAEMMMPLMKTLGKVLGHTLVFSLRATLVPIRLFIGAVTTVVNIVSLIAAMIKGDWSQVAVIWEKLWSGLWTTIVDVVKLGIGQLPSIIAGIFKFIVEGVVLAIRGLGSTIVNMFGNLGEALRQKLANTRFIGRFFGGRSSEVAVANDAAARADDMVSRPGYGERTLVTPQGNVALNNQDNVVAYADDMIARNTGIELLSKGAIAQSASNPAPVVNVDVSRLERKLDQMLTAIGSMEVRMDGSSVGRIVTNSEQRSSIGVGFNVARG
jgi:hypothetical protein